LASMAVHSNIPEVVRPVFGCSNLDEVFWHRILKHWCALFSVRICERELWDLQGSDVDEGCGRLL